MTKAQKEAKQEIQDDKTSIRLDITSQRDVIDDITSQAMKTCCEDIGTKIFEKGSDIVKKLKHKLKTENNDHMELTTMAWNKITEEMTAANTRLVHTNRPAIKNNNILKAKIKKAENSVSKLTETIDDQAKILHSLELRSAEAITHMEKDENDTAEVYLNNARTVLEKK